MAAFDGFVIGSPDATHDDVINISTTSGIPSDSLSDSSFTGDVDVEGNF